MEMLTIIFGLVITFGGIGIFKIIRGTKKLFHINLIPSFDTVECSTAEDVLQLARLLQKCEDFKVVQCTWKSKDKIIIHSIDFQLTQLHLTLEDDMTDGCRALGEQLKRFAKVK